MKKEKHKTALHQQAAYRDKNKERNREAQKAWRLKNPRKVQAAKDAAKAKRNGKDPEVAIETPDNLLLTLHITLTDAETEYLTTNKEMGRPQLYRAFREQFNSNINKLQLNFAIEAIWEKAIKQGEKRQKLA